MKKKILPSAKWLRKHGMGKLISAMRERPELFAQFETEPDTVEERALVRRINRKLTDGERLCVSRNRRMESNLGRFYILDAQSNLVACHCDIEELGRELGVLGTRERMAA